MFITEIRKLRWTLDVAAPPRPDRGLQLLPRGLRTPRRGRGISFKYHFASFWSQEEPRVPFFFPRKLRRPGGRPGAVAVAAGGAKEGQKEGRKTKQNK